jgi:hypothetical protein
MVNEETIVSSDTELTGSTQGPVRVRSGAVLTLAGTHDGPIDVEGSGELRVTGVVRGSLNIASLGTAVVSGDIMGAIEIKVAGTLVVEASGRVAGPVSNYGSFTNHGMRVGRADGRVPDDQPGSVDVPPSGTGAYNYELPDRA